MLKVVSEHRAAGSMLDAREQLQGDSDFGHFCLIGPQNQCRFAPAAIPSSAAAAACFPGVVTLGRLP